MLRARGRKKSAKGPRGHVVKLNFIVTRDVSIPMRNLLNDRERDARDLRVEEGHGARRPSGSNSTRAEDEFMSDLGSRAERERERGSERRPLRSNGSS